MSDDKDIVLLIRTSHSTTFKNLLDSLKSVLNESNLIVSQSGITLTAVDNNKTAVVHLYLDSNSFQHFYCGEERIILGVDIELLQKPIRTNKNNDTLTFTLRKSNRAFLEISYENLDKRSKVTALLPLKTLQESQITNTIDYPVPTELESLAFQGIVREMVSIQATMMGISREGDKITFKNINGDLTRMTEICVTGSLLDTPEQNGIFLLSYLKSFAKAASLSPTVKIFLADEQPLMLEYSVDTLGTLRYLLAPFEC